MRSASRASSAFDPHNPVPSTLGSENTNENTHPSSEKLRLCFISNPNLIHTRRWVSWFANRKHTVCLLADVPLKEPWTDMPVIDLSKVFYGRYIRFPIWTIWLKRFIKQWKPDILHAHRINSAGWMAAASGFHPYVITPWGLDIFTQPLHSWLARILARYTLSHADLITTISNEMGNYAMRFGARKEALQSIQFGLELDIFKPVSGDDPDLIRMRNSLSLPENARIVFSPRAVTPIYNLDIILKSIPLIRSRFPEAVFIFLDYNTDIEYKKLLDSIIEKMGLKSAMRWLPATKSRKEMAELYRLSEIVVSVPSTDGGTPISILEAFACAKPVVCTDLPQLSDFIRNGETGVLVPIGQVDPLADAIIQLLEHPAEASLYGQMAYQVAVEKANQDVEMQRMEAIYYQLAAAGSK